MMPITTCANCSFCYSWSWEDAFDKFGFCDGDGQVMTDEVVCVLRAAGYEVSAAACGLHNVTIRSIKREGVEQKPEHVDLGYADPRKYVPQIYCPAPRRGTWSQYGSRPRTTRRM
jgi:hypothetical protein